MGMRAHPVVAGRRAVYYRGTRNVRSIFREHLRFHKMTIKGDLARILRISPIGAASLMTKSYPLAPQQVDAFIEEMKLDEFDAYELRLLGAMEAGWQLNKGEKIQ